MPGLDEVIKTIAPLDKGCMQAAQKRLDALTKPQGSLAALEELVCLYAGARQTARLALPCKAIVLMAADHGIAADKVSAYPQQVTAQMVYNFVNGGAGINVLARHAGAELILVDVGVADELEPDLPIRHYKVRRGTGNMRMEPAMSRAEAIRAINVGVQIANELADNGFTVIGLGEMGIGNTTASSAITSVLLGKPAAAVTGLGTGIEPKLLEHKVRVIEEAIRVNKPERLDPLDVLAKVGGLEIAALTGIVLASAARRMLVVMDGFISAAAALLAVRLAPPVKPYLIASHLSAEPGHGAILREIGVKPKLTLDLRLGEGTGAALGMILIDAAIKVYNEMATFSEAGIAGA